MGHVYSIFSPAFRAKISAMVQQTSSCQLPRVYPGVTLVAPKAVYSGKLSTAGGPFFNAIASNLCKLLSSGFASAIAHRDLLQEEDDASMFMPVCGSVQKQTADDPLIYICRYLPPKGKPGVFRLEISLSRSYNFVDNTKMANGPSYQL